MDPVVIKGKTDQKRVHSEYVLKVADNRNRTSGADRDGFLAPFLGQRVASFAKRRIIERHIKCRSTGEVAEFNSAVRRHTSADEFTERMADLLRVLCADQAEGHFRHRLAGNDGLSALPGIAGEDAVHFRGGPGRDLLDQHAVLFARRDLQSDRHEEFLRREIKAGKIGFDVGGKFRDTLVETGNSDRSVRPVQRRQDFGQHMDWISRGAAEQARMQVAIRASQPHLFINQTAKRGGDRRRCGVPHASVADQRQIALELLRMVADEAEQMLRAAFLLAFDQHRDVERKFAGHRLKRAARFNKRHRLAFVVASAAGDDDFAPVIEGVYARFEWRRVPKIERVDRLYIVVAVEEHARRLAISAVCALADDDWICNSVNNRSTLALSSRSTRARTALTLFTLMITPSRSIPHCHNQSPLNRAPIAGYERSAAFL